MTDITLEAITKIYGSGPAAVAAVEDVHLHVDSGEFFFLLGPSGCGKTTLLRIVAGLIEPTAGRILFGDQDVTDMPVERRNTAMVFQSYALWPHMTVTDNVEFGPKMSGADRAERREVARQSLARVRMEDFGRRKPNQLSGGQQQRVALARALAARPECLLLDEPLSNLDARLRMHMRGQLRDLVKSTGTTGIYVTHDQKEALSMADRIAVMNAGRIVQVGTPHEIYHRPANYFVADFLGEANFIDGTLAAGGEVATVQTPVGTIRAENPAGLETGTDVTCCIRPEHLSVASGPSDRPGDQTALAGEVDSSIFLGEVRQYACRVPGGGTWRATVLADAIPPIEAGRPVELRVHPRNVALLIQ